MEQLPETGIQEPFLRDIYAGRRRKFVAAHRLGKK
jgi:hypothetical protein